LYKLALALGKTVQEISSVPYEEIIGWQIYLTECEPTTSEMINYTNARNTAVLNNLLSDKKVTEKDCLLEFGEPEQDKEWWRSSLAVFKANAKTK
jgi:hypothetical protein